MIEQRQLKEQLSPINENFDAKSIQNLLRDFMALSRHVEPEELQHLMRLVIRRIEWKTQGNTKVQFYQLGATKGQKTNCPPTQRAGGQWLYTDVCNDTPSRRNLEPLIFEVHYHADDTPNLDFTRVMRPKAQPVGGESRRVSQAVSPAVSHPNQEKEVV